MPCLRLLRIRLTHIFHPNPTFLDKVKGLEYTATLIVDFLLFKAKLYNFRHKIFYFIGLLQPRRPQKALIMSVFLVFCTFLCRVLSLDGTKILFVQNGNEDASLWCAKSLYISRVVNYLYSCNNIH